MESTLLFICILIFFIYDYKNRCVEKGKSKARKSMLIDIGIGLVACLILWFFDIRSFNDMPGWVYILLYTSICLLAGFEWGVHCTNKKKISKEKSATES